MRSSRVDDRPAMQFYLKDWIADTRVLTLAERGLWIDALAYMWRSPRRGYLLMQNGCKPDANAMQNLFGTEAAVVEETMSALLEGMIATAWPDQVFAMSPVGDEHGEASTISGTLC